MTQKTVTLFAAVGLLLCTFVSCATNNTLSSLTPEQIAQIEKTTWRIELKSDITKTLFGALQWTIFETDPLPLLRKSFALREKINAGEKQTDFDISIEQQIDWDQIFDTISGRDVFLLQAKSGKYGGPLISANTSSATKWVVSKAVLKKDGSFNVWCIPFEAKIGETQTIELTDKNTFDITTLNSQ